MSGRPIALAAVAALAAAAMVAGCSRDDASDRAPKVRSLGVRAAPPNVAAPASDVDASAVVPEHVPIETPTAPPPPVMYTVTTKTDGGAKPQDPDVAVVESARDAASRCFTNISDGSTSRFASIHVIVLPSGSVSRSDVSAPTTHEGWILSCLDGVASGLRFSDKPKADLRNFTINVSVSRAH